MTCFWSGRLYWELSNRKVGISCMNSDLWLVGEEGLFLSFALYWHWRLKLGVSPDLQTLWFFIPVRLAVQTLLSFLGGGGGGCPVRIVLTSVPAPVPGFPFWCDCFCWAAAEEECCGETWRWCGWQCTHQGSFTYLSVVLAFSLCGSCGFLCVCVSGFMCVLWLSLCVLWLSLCVSLALCLVAFFMCVSGFVYVLWLCVSGFMCVLWLSLCVLWLSLCVSLALCVSCGFVFLALCVSCGFLYVCLVAFFVCVWLYVCLVAIFMCLSGFTCVLWLSLCTYVCGCL